MDVRAPGAPRMVSIVVPAYNEEDNVPVLVDRIEAAVRDLPHLLEVVIVDDGSSDRTWQRISAAASASSSVVGYRLSRNFGHQSALLAGLRHARGDAVISMDGDLQHPPEMIPALVEAWENGYEIVHTRRLDTAVSGPFKRWTSKLFYKLFSVLSEIDVSEGSSDFRLLDRRPLDSMLDLRDRDLFLRGAVQWLGFRSVTIPYQAGSRYSGTSKYSLGRMLRFAAGAVISYSTKPLRLGIWIGLMTSLLAFGELAFILIQYSRGNTIPGWASILSVVSFLFGILFILLGIIGSYLACIHGLLQSRPPFIVAETTVVPRVEAEV